MGRKLNTKKRSHYPNKPTSTGLPKGYKVNKEQRRFVKK